MKKKAVFNWSGGKDSALALKYAIDSGEYEIVSLLTTINIDTKESTLHRIPKSLLQKQTEAIGISSYVVEMRSDDNMQGYEAAMQKAVDHFKSLGVTAFIFGDIHLHEIKKYREDKLSPMGIEVIEPLWHLTSTQAMQQFIDSKLKTVIVTVTKPELKEYVGRLIDSSFTENYPNEFDICGENGEYHTFCYDGAIFKNPVTFNINSVNENNYEVTYDGKTEKVQYWYAVLNDSE